MLRALLFALAAFAAVDLTVYLWHRFAQHGGWAGAAVRRAHLEHHANPAGTTRADRLEWYLIGAAALGVSWLALDWRDWIPFALVVAVYGKALGMIHEWIHDAEGNAVWRDVHPTMSRVIDHHQIHHLVPANYGVLLFWPDRMFGTYR